MDEVAVRARIHLQPQGVSENRPTIVASASPARLLLRHAADPRALFVAHYGAFKRLAAASEEPGLAVFAVNNETGCLVAAAHLAAPVGRTAHLIVGRHSECELRLPAEEVALRQLAVVLEPLRARGRSLEFRYRVMDLRTGAGGFATDQGHTVSSVEVTGPAHFRVGGYTLFCLLTGDPTDYPESAADAWDCLPEAVHLNEQGARLGRAEGSAPHAFPESSAPPARRITLVSQVAPAAEARVRPTLADGQLGLRLSCDGVVEYVPLTEAAQSQGVLLGRYERCQSTVLGRAERLSRVHALVLFAANEIWLFDTASTNGTAVDGRLVLRVALKLGRDVELAEGAATLRLVRGGGKFA